ncbi:hypothetical protein SAMN06269185_0760 [Natronoarchaeum philippinense]|uniref:ZIP Zinc transporter n=1 Tax=Natronoarchaeum philippinense TaxID=558529 RepID=A0A285N6G7_NATPI|nr:hypothetical protein [Natronoarchaeum philippinense]SNZ05052.1 hypothetical protein SAMN06269185_0760 [Natronoarchaeum philippinense]
MPQSVVSVAAPTGLAAIALAAAHVGARRLRVSAAIPRSAWLSVAGGAAVAYVFVHILPELSAGQATLEGTIGFLEHHAYLVALVGFGTFYGVERLAVIGQDRARLADFGDESIFWIHITAFAGYNALIGYLLVHRETPSTLSLVLFAVAMGLHFLVNDYGLRRHHEDAYDRRGRWVLALAVLVGWAIGLAVDVPEAAVATLFAFLAGSVILNVIKEELPAERDGRFWAFAVGATAYSAVLLVV